ncbi:MAG TPA: prepilin-type N-terminal cleavage/methylation domain-containing protein [Burkholderiales bacterium]|nr:prepilin-type N-terminal cleavage/methylation domain-containing protein [Burkholderiales bacterium]
MSEMKIDSSRGDRGFSLLEFVVVIVIVSVLLVIAISRLLVLQVDAERVAMETVTGTLRSAIGIKVAESLVKHQIRDLGLLEGSNPMDRLAEFPRNYLGEFDNTDPRALENGNWYFDRSSRVLVYVVRNDSFFEGGLPDPPRARFAVQLVYTDRNANGRFDATIDSVEGLRLAALEPYQWKK